MQTPKLTPAQKKARLLLNNNLHTLLFGGSRSGKTTIILRNVILRAMKTRSRHLITRLRFNHVMSSIWHDSFPKVMTTFFPGVPYSLDKRDYFITLPVNNSDSKSEIWLGGIDQKERIEKILGNEYSTIFGNEVSQISYDAILTLRTRLAENSGLNLRFYYDCNPSSKRHWAYQEFVERVNPDSAEPSTIQCDSMRINPVDNAHNLPAQYMEILRTLPKRARDRFLEGLFLSDVEGALWDDEMVIRSKVKEPGTVKFTAIGVDPAVSTNATSDETGIIVASLDENNDAVIEEDLTIKAKPNVWGQRVVNAYRKYGASVIIAEANQGGDLVETVLKNIDKSVKVKLVHASKGKFARAEPVAFLYEQGRVAHREGLHELESQYVEYVPIDSKKSPDRLDAAVWVLTFLMLSRKSRIHVG